MKYPDIDYINELKFYILELSYYVRKRKNLDKRTIEKMMSLTIDLLQMLELYLDDKYDY